MPGPMDPTAPENLSAASSDPHGSDYPALLPLEQARPPQDWKEAAIPRDAFKSFRYPEQRNDRQAPPKRPSRRWSVLVWVIVSLGVVAFFALLVNIILPGPAGLKPTVHTVPAEHSTPPKVTEESIDPPKERSVPGIQDR